LNSANSKLNQPFGKATSYSEMNVKHVSHLLGMMNVLWKQIWIKKSNMMKLNNLRFHLQINYLNIARRGAFVTHYFSSLIWWYKVCHELIKARKSIWLFRVTFDHFWRSDNFWGSWDSIENWLEPITKEGATYGPRATSGPRRLLF